MRKNINSIREGLFRATAICLGSMFITASVAETTKADYYSWSKAVEYAKKYHGEVEDEEDEKGKKSNKKEGEQSEYNSAYASFSSDCTNFVSQCAKAGGYREVRPATFKYNNKITTNVFTWYSTKNSSGKYSVSKTWVNCNAFRLFMADEKDVPVRGGLTADQVRKYARLGDVVQVQVNGNAQHSLIVVDKTKNDIFMAAHTNNRKRSSLSAQDEYWKDGVPDSCVSYSIIRLTQYK